ncbi:MAG: IS3 family transposase [Thermoanaerobaculia bacterium]|nr:IS3 family transposase [Thermoanaerobaculia bacterium]
MGQIDAKVVEVSIRRISSWLRLRRSGYYEKKGKGNPDTSIRSDECVLQLMKKIRRMHRAWGFRLIFAYMRKEGEKIGKRRAHRLYMNAKMSLHRNPKKPRIKRVFEKLLPPEKINEGWAMDFLSEWVIGEKQQSVRIINVVDECSRKDLWVEAAHSITAAKLVEVLDKIVGMRGKPRYIRCDNGPEFISAVLKEWATENKIEIKFIQPGKPTQNGIIERLNGTVRKECLNLNWFHSLEEINDLLGQWYKAYNFDRPHSCLKYQTPAAFENLNQSLYFKMVPL